MGFLFRGWFPQWLQNNQSWLEKRFPALWLRGLSFSYSLTNGLGKLSTDDPKSSI